jgi:hypothetical protein
VKTGEENLARVRTSTIASVQIAAIFEQFDFSNWRTDAGDLDIMTTMPDRTGSRRRYANFVDGAQTLDYAGVRIRVVSLHGLRWSPARSDQLVSLSVPTRAAVSTGSGAPLRVR